MATAQQTRAKKGIVTVCMILSYLLIVAPQRSGQCTSVILHAPWMWSAISSLFIFIWHMHITSDLGHVSLCSSFSVRLIFIRHRGHSTLTSGHPSTWSRAFFTGIKALQPLHVQTTFSSSCSAKMFRQNPINWARHLWHLSRPWVPKLSAQVPQIVWPHDVVDCGFTNGYVLQET